MNLPVNSRLLRRVAALAATAFSAPLALAHEGHGLHGPHWHATDAWGFVAVGALVMLAVWLSRGGK
jgi:hypothetical protein